MPAPLSHEKGGNPMANPTQNKEGIKVLNDLRPAYYDDFRCLAGGCQNTCCKGWSITFSKKDYLALKRQEGSPELNACLAEGVRRIRRKSGDDTFYYGEFDMSGGVCSLLQEGGLCGLQVEKGHEALPFVCQSYPRRERYMLSGYLERSLSPRCEGVLALLWDLPEGVEFRSSPLLKGQYRSVRPVSDEPMPLWFAPVREWCIDMMQDRRFSLPHRIWLMGLGLKDLAEGETDIQRWMERAAILPGSVDVEGILPTGTQELILYMLSCIHILNAIETDNPLAARILGSLVLDSHRTDGVKSARCDPYLKARKRFEENFRGREYFMENLMVSLFFYLHMPHMSSKEELWKSYVNFCNLYAFFRFMAVMSCQEGMPGDRDELFRHMVFASRSLLHNEPRRGHLRDELFQNGSATLAHMAILLSG